MDRTLQALKLPILVRVFGLEPLHLAHEALVVPQKVLLVSLVFRFTLLGLLKLQLKLSNPAVELMRLLRCLCFLNDEGTCIAFN